MGILKRLLNYSVGNSLVEKRSWLESDKVEGETYNRTVKSCFIQITKLWDRWDAQTSLGLTELIDMTNLFRVGDSSKRDQAKLDEKLSSFTKRVDRLQEIYFEIAGQISQTIEFSRSTCSNRVSCSDKSSPFPNCHPSFLSKLDNINMMNCDNNLKL